MKLILIIIQNSVSLERASFAPSSHQDPLQYIIILSCIWCQQDIKNWIYYSMYQLNETSNAQLVPEPFARYDCVYQLKATYFQSPNLQALLGKIFKDEKKQEKVTETSVRSSSLKKMSTRNILLSCIVPEGRIENERYMHLIVTKHLQKRIYDSEYQLNKTSASQKGSLQLRKSS